MRSSEQALLQLFAPLRRLATGVWSTVCPLTARESASSRAACATVSSPSSLETSRSTLGPQSSLEDLLMLVKVVDSFSKRTFLAAVHERKWADLD
eukprot:m.428977 g.428977  ORF g.428977 m.428977 type:complete len:95 (-) comp56713_c0_seq1:89-373(-)